jgi:medium-chain acyl-[acyl-carrier-protein] hydrolase
VNVALVSESLFVRRAALPGARLRLICLPHGGAGASFYGPWRELLPAEVDLVAIQLPGREDRLFEQPFARLDPLVRTVAQAIRPYLTLPCGFFGHSGGALIAFELARELERRFNVSALHLFVAGWPAPHTRSHAVPIHQLPDAQFLDAVREIGGMPPDTPDNADLLQLLLPGLRADFSLSEQYVYRSGPALRCPITALGGSHDPRVSLDELEGWGEHTQRQFSVRLFDGGHFFVRDAAPEVVGCLADALQSDQPASPSHQHLA